MAAGAVPVIVDPEWLGSRLADPAVRVADCRFVLGDPHGGRALYDAGHIPGAVFLDVDEDLSAPPAPAGPRGPVGGRHPLPDRGRLERALRRAGVSGDTHVVAYDQGDAGGAARLWWLLRHHGHARASVLRGGIGAWTGRLEQAPPDVAPGSISLAPGRDDTVSADDLAAGGDRLLLDARVPERFRGEAEPVDPVAGHIPGALNVPAAGALPPPRELLDEPRELVAYCGSGIAACAVVLGLAAAGRDDARLYPGSWSDWVARGGAVQTGP
jgi:thiosulfate/3-mercaptopyruvate sulfurtransferase